MGFAAYQAVQEEHNQGVFIYRNVFNRGAKQEGEVIDMTMDQLESKMFEAIREITISDIGNDELAGYIRGMVHFDLELRKVLEKGDQVKQTPQ